MNMKKINLTDIKPAPSNYAAAGDLMRVFCVFMVGWYHIWQQSWLSPMIAVGPLTLNMHAYVRAGYAFVDLMLMLSGFLLYLPYANGTERGPREFYIRRALRILPSYWLCMAVMLALAVTSPDFTDPGRLMKDLAAHLTFTHNLFRLSYTATRLNVALWTLAVEVQFYLLLPVLAPVFRKRPVACYLLMTGAALSFRVLWTSQMPDTTLFVNRLPNMLDVYANGMLAAHLYAKLARCERRRGLIAALGTLALVAGIWGVLREVRLQATAGDYDALRQNQLDHRWLLSAWGAAALAGGSLSFGPVRWLCSNRVVRFLSGVSFNFYIWHQWLAVKLKEWRVPPYLAEANPNYEGEMPWQLNYTLLCFLAALVLATIITYCVEKPAAKAGRKWFERRNSE